MKHGRVILERNLIAARGPACYDHLSQSSLNRPAKERMSTPDRPSQRIVSLDQFRGYTVLGMFFVNFVGKFDAIPDVFKHHNTYCSYADTIMPQFFFAVGFAYRLTLLRRLETVGSWAAYRHAIGRNLGLILLGAVIYHLDGSVDKWADLEKLGLWGFITTAFQREFFETLVHIGVTALWILPVIAASGFTRLAFAVMSGTIHWILSNEFYYQWVMQRPGIDGGPLGFLTWTIPMLAGSFAYDALRTSEIGKAVWQMAFWGTILAVMGYALACINTVTPPNEPGSNDIRSFLVEPPFIKAPERQNGTLVRPANIWTMSQRAGSASYLVFTAGLSFVVYAIFVVACDIGRLRIGIFRTLGSNALVAYIIHPMVFGLIKPYAPKDAPLWYVLAATSLALGICYFFVRYLEKNKIYLKL
jgi:predicted acyltransferase